MSNIRIFSKKAFAIGEGLKPGSDNIDIFTTVPNSFQDMPARFVEDPTFKLAVKYGEITVINSTAIEKSVQEEEVFTDDEAGSSEINAFYEELKVMSKDDTAALGEKFNVKPANKEKLGQYKKRIMEAYKISVAELSDHDPDSDHEEDDDTDSEDSAKD